MVAVKAETADAVAPEIAGGVVSAEAAVRKIKLADTARLPAASRDFTR
jgi:hypothetical protein